MSEDHGLRRIGNLVSKIENSLPAWESALGISGTKPTSSGTIGDPRPVPARANAIGPPSGETGLAALPRLTDALARLDAEAIDRGLARFLAPLETSSIRPIVTADFTLIGYELTGTIDADTLGQLRRVIGRLLLPASPEAIANAMHRCLLACKSRERAAEDIRLMVAVFMSDLAEFPEDVVATAFRQWARREPWWPSLAEIREECNRMVRIRRSIGRLCKDATK